MNDKADDKIKKVAKVPRLRQQIDLPLRVPPRLMGEQKNAGIKETRKPKTKKR